MGGFMPGGPELMGLSWDTGRIHNRIGPLPAIPES